MSNRPFWIWIAAVLAVLAPPGCRGPFKKLRYHGQADLQYYKDAATEVDYTHVCREARDEAVFTLEPRSIREHRKDEIRELRLGEAIQLALANSEIIRDRGQFLAPGNQLFANPDFVPSIYNPAIQESGVLFGQRGVEAALSDFDAQFTTNMLWGRNETVQNNRFQSGGLSPGDTLFEESGQFVSRLEKTFADSSTFAVNHNWNYSLNNTPARLFGSVYTGLLQFDYRRPLWAGSGTEFTRIAGPIGQQLRGVTGVFQGVVIARINNDISIADFEASVRNLMKDVEDLYWELYLAYRSYHSEVVARDSARKVWEQVFALRGQTPGEAQARDNYFEARNRAEQALADVYSIEAQLRRLLGLPVNDGTILRPVDDPIVADYDPDWHLALSEALTERVELRRQKWNIKSLELQLQAAESLTRPRLDFVSNYRINGFGNRLFGQSDDDNALIRDNTGNVIGVGSQQGLRSAYETLTQGNQTGWNVGLEFSMPIGFRAAHAQVRNLEHRLARARAVLSTQEHEVSHELAHVFRELDRWYQTAITAFNRRRAAERRVRQFEADYARRLRLGGPAEAGGAAEAFLDLVLRAQISLSQADIAYHRAVAEYNKALADLHFRKGTLLERNNVQLAEGLWSPEAYDEALRRAWARSHAIPNRFLHSQPREFEWDCPPPADFPLPPEEPGAMAAPVRPAEPPPPPPQ